MDKAQNYFSKLPLSMVAYIFQLYPINEIAELSKVCKRFQNALKQEFMWENFAINDELFLPKEKEHFKWREYFFYLKKLKENIQSGKPNYNFKMKPLRFHKDYITAINYLYYGCSYKIVSGDNKGVVLTWRLDKEEDYESVIITELNEPITRIITVNGEKLLIETEGSFTLIEYDVLNDLFTIESKYNKNKTDNFTYITIEEGLIYFSADIQDYNTISKTNQAVYCYNLMTWKRVNEYYLNYDSDTKSQIYSLTEYKETIPARVRSQFPPFILINNKLIVIANFEPIRKYPLSVLFTEKKMQTGNCFIFDTNSILAKPENVIIPFKYINDIVYINKEKGLFGFIGKNLNANAKHLLLIYRIDSITNELILHQSVSIGFNLEIMRLVFYSSTKLVFHEGNTKIRVKTLDSNKNPEFLFKDKGSVLEIKALACDPLRIVACYNTNIVDVYNIKTNQRWYSLCTGSNTIIPKSFVKHPSCEGINKVIVTRWSIIGVIGNLIREYSFKPTYIYKQK